MLGPLLFLWLSVSVYRQVVRQPDFGAHLERLGDALSGPRAWMLPVVVALVFVNWAVETLKWQVLMDRVHAMGFPTAFRAVLAGLAFSLGTPNRVGDFGGRMLFLPEGSRGRSIGPTLFAGFSQLMVTLMMGSAGLAVLGERFREAGGAWVDALQSIVLLCILLGSILFLRPDLFTGLFTRLPGGRRLEPYAAVVGGLPAGDKARVLLLSVVRFIVFGIQYCLMLRYMAVGIGWWEGFWAVAVFYLAMTLLPTVALLELGFRWQFSLLVFGVFTDNLLGVYVAATGIWMLNLLLPAAAGGLLSIGVKPFGQGSVEEAVGGDEGDAGSTRAKL